MDAKTLETADPALRDSLVAENEPDLMQNEQTWPTREELDKAGGTFFKDIYGLSLSIIVS